jgi:hypothetical protein
VTDVAISPTALNGTGPQADPAVEVVAGPEVQALVAHSEQVIQALRQELEVALREAEEAEHRVTSHPAAVLLGHDQSDPTAPVAITPPGPDGTGAAPRTTVVSRPRANAADGRGAGESSGYQHSAPGSGLFRSHLVLKLGVLLAVLAVLLLLFA